MPTDSQLGYLGTPLLDYDLQASREAFVASVIVTMYIPEGKPSVATIAVPSPGCTFWVDISVPLVETTATRLPPCPCGSVTVTSVPAVMNVGVTSAFTVATERPKKTGIDKIFMIMKDCLCDWCGNYSMPSVRLETDPVNEATKVEWIGDNNVRAYMSKLPESGTWNNGDEVLLPTSINRYYNGRWLSESTKIAVIKPEL